MKRPRFRLIFCLLFVLFFISPGVVSGMPAPGTSEHDLLPPVSEVAPPDTSFGTHPSGPPPTEYEVEVRADKGVYIEEDTPGANWNHDTHLRVGRTTEFGYLYWTLLHFPPTTEAHGGPIPDGAEITGARMKLYKESGPAGTVNVFRLTDDFAEDTVTWNSKPAQYAVAESTPSVPAAQGWCCLDIPTAMLAAGGLKVFLCPTWTDVGRQIVFSSDEHPSYGPTLVISYLGEAPEPTPPPPSPPAGDTTPCELTYTVTPSHPRVGQSVTVTATATDDQAMWYVSIRRGSFELAKETATSGERELTVSHTEPATLPSLTYTIIADDLGDPPAVGTPIITVPVAGTGTVPEVTVTAEWLDVEEVIPERYRLIRGDGQRVRITATASDPDGIRMLTISVSGAPRDFTYEGDTSVSQTVEWVNDEPSRTRFYYSASAQDAERNYVHADGESFDIVGPDGIRLMWSEAPGFRNPSTPTISWGRMVETFGAGECWWVERWGWRDPSDWNYYNDNVRTLCAGGECFGMSTLALEMYNGRIAASDLEYPCVASQLDYANSYTKEWVECRQAGQAGEEVQVPKHAQEGVGHMEVLSWIEDDLENDDPGVIGIREGGEGHAVVPWMSRHMPDGTTRVYIYDCNKVSGIHNPAADINTFRHYPFIVFDSPAWSYQMGRTTVWNDVIKYVTYEQACGDMGQLITDPRLGSDAPLLTDHDVPTSSDFNISVVGGQADVYFEDEEGNVTGIYEGQLREEIPGSMAVIPMMGGSFSEHEMYALPADRKLWAYAVGQADGEYNLSLIGDNSLVAIEGKSVSKGSKDALVFDSIEGILGKRVRMMPGEADDDFIVRLAFAFAGRVEATDTDEIGREYVVEEASATEESDFSCYVEEGGDTLVVESYGDDIEFDMTMRSTESADYISPDEELPYIPGSTEEDVTVERGRRVEATPEDWATTEEGGKLHTLKKRTEGDGGAGFPIIPIVIGFAAAAAVGATVTVLLKRGVFGKAKKG